MKENGKEFICPLHVFQLQRYLKGHRQDFTEEKDFEDQSEGIERKDHSHSLENSGGEQNGKGGSLRDERSLNV